MLELMDSMKMSEQLTMLTKFQKFKYGIFTYLLLILLIMASTECRILTWNVRGIVSSAGSLSKLLDDKNIDIAIISEHKLREQQETFLNSVHSNY